MVVIVGTILELGARQIGPELPILRDLGMNIEIMVGHPTRLWTMSPGLRQNAGPMASIHASGLRGKVPEGPRASDEERILILGDSSFFGHGVADSDTLPVKLQGRLEADGHTVTVINGAMLGYSSEQARILMEEQGWALEPTLLVIGLLWSDNTWDLFRDDDLIRTTRQFSGNPLARSSFYQLLAGRIDRLRGGQGAHIITWTRESEWPDQRVRRVGLRRYAENLDSLVREAAARGIGSAFIAPANRDTVTPVPTNEPPSWQVYFDAMARVASHHGTPLIAARDPLADALAADLKAGIEQPLDDLFLDKMHPTPRGNRLIAEAVHTRLRAYGWPDRVPLGHQDTAIDLDKLSPDSHLGDLIHSQELDVSPHMRLFSSEAP